MEYPLISNNAWLKPGAVIQKYYEKDVIERSCRTMKGDMQPHPIRLWLPPKGERTCQTLLSINVVAFFN